MSKSEKKGLVPALRFPEFQNAGEWNVDLLGNNKVAKLVKERVTLAQLRLQTYISTENLLSDYGGVTVSSKLPPSGSFTRYEKCDVLISNIRPYLKKVWVSDRDGACSNDVVVIRSGEKINSKFFAFVLKNDKFINYVMESAKGVKMPRGDISSMKDYPVTFPKDKEQQKIADCLASIDDLITAETQKLASLKTHKKGLMQQLFPAEGETVPRLRFPEFRDGAEWDEKTLGDICEMQAGKFVSASEIKDKATDVLYPCYGGNGLRGFTKTFTNDGKYSLIGRQGALCGNVTIASGLFHATEHAVVVTPNEGVSTDWLYYMLIYLNLNQFATGQAQPGLSVENLKSVALKFTHERGEQQKIADCLSSVDELITAQSEKIDALKLHKKGLMQQLFPAVDNHPTPSGHPSTGGELRQHHSPPVEGWQAQPDGVVSPTTEGN